MTLYHLNSLFNKELTLLIILFFGQSSYR